MIPCGVCKGRNQHRGNGRRLFEGQAAAHGIAAQFEPAPKWRKFRKNGMTRGTRLTGLPRESRYRRCRPRLDQNSGADYTTTRDATTPKAAAGRKSGATWASPANLILPPKSCTSLGTDVAFHLGASMRRLELAAIAATCASVGRGLITYRLGDLRGFRAACAHAEETAPRAPKAACKIMRRLFRNSTSNKPFMLGPPRNAIGSLTFFLHAVPS